MDRTYKQYRKYRNEEAVTLTEAFAHVQAHRLTETLFDECSVTAVFENGSYLRIESEYEGPYSEVTPGEGIQPPTLYIGERIEPL